MKGPKTKGNKKTVCVLLSTYNGEEYLKEQLDSVLAQEDVDVKIFVRDDGSKDETVEILKEYETKGLLQLCCGNNLGFSKSFSWLIANAPQADFYACCDQDDVWLPKKLINGVKCLESKDNSVPQLYFTNRIVVDKNFKEVLTTTQRFVENPKHRLLESSLINVVSGCCAIFNGKLKEEYSKIQADMIPLAHDYTLYVLASALGEVSYDNNPQILYRQHGTDEFGFNKGRFYSIKRAMKIAKMYGLNNVRSREMLNLKYLFYDKLSSQDKEYVDLVVKYKYCKDGKKQLKKYIKENSSLESSRKFGLYLLRIGKF